MIKRPFLILAVLCWLIAASAVSCYVGVLGDETSRGNWPWIVVALGFAALGVAAYRRKDKPAS